METVDLLTYTREIFNGKLHILSSVDNSVNFIGGPNFNEKAYFSWKQYIG